MVQDGFGIGDAKQPRLVNSVVLFCLSVHWPTTRTEHLSDAGIINYRGASFLPDTPHQLPAACCIDASGGCLRVRSVMIRALLLRALPEIDGFI